MTTITEIRERLAAITPGTWYVGSLGDEYDERLIEVRETGEIVASTHLDRYNEPQRDQDAAFIAAAPEDIRYLLELVTQIQHIVSSSTSDRYDGARIRELFESLGETLDDANDGA